MSPSFRRALCAFGFVVAAGPAFAHAHLLSATPAMGGTVATAPTTLALTFSEGVNLAFTGVTVTGADKAPVGTGPLAHGPGGEATLVVPLTGTLPAGPYTVDWHALASDGHKTNGTYRFTLKP